MLVVNIDAEFLRTALRSIKAGHGSIDAYLAEALDVDAAAQERLRVRPIEEMD